MNPKGFPVVTIVQLVNRRNAMAVALPLHFRRGTTNLRYFMTLTTLGTALDVTAQELRIESYFPMDAETEAFAGRADPEGVM
jgi:hypothetical protein